MLTDWLIGGDYTAPSCGGNTYGCVSSLSASLDFMVNTSGSSWFNDGVHYGLGSGYNAVNWSVRSDTETPVPEPGMLLLSGLGLAGLAFVRRRRAV